MASLWQKLSRRRQDDGSLTGEKSELARVLGLVDLVALGVGATLGLGVYVLAGSVAKEKSGPAVCVAFLVAAIASAFAGLCYAEFASRVPKAGSAYVYSYVTVGEFVAFIIGWNLLLEYVIGTASVARGVSGYVDFLTNNAMRTFFESNMRIQVPFLARYPDFFAFALVVLLTMFLSIQVKESTRFNNIFTALNLITIVTIVVTGITRIDPANWNVNPDLVVGFNKTSLGVGGFMPFGWEGVMEGAAICFFGFVGFDSIAATGEEAKNPQKNIPLAIIISLTIVFFAYFSISTVLTMMWPYYDQNPDAPFPAVYEKIDWPTVKWIVNLGAVFALFTSLVGAMFPLPRILYAMASDGLIFRFLARVHPKTQTPIIGTIVSGILTGITTLIFDLKQLIDMMSIGTLLAYTIVAVSVLILRYQRDDVPIKVAHNAHPDSQVVSLIRLFQSLFNLQNHKEPSEFSAGIAKWGVLLFSILVLIFGYIVCYQDLSTGNVLLIIILAVSLLMMILIVTAIGRQPVQQTSLSFKVPLVPLIPCLSIIINIYLMLKLDPDTWIRFGVWMVMGLAIYFFYGLRNSSQGKKNELQGMKCDQKPRKEQLQDVTKC